MNPISPLIAAGWIEFIGPAVVVFFYIISHLLSAANNKAAPPPKRVPQGRDPGVPPQPPRTLEEKLRSEVEQFLRQVQGEPEKPVRPEQPSVPARPMVVTVAPAPADASELALPHESIEAHVARTVSTADITQHAATLGAVVGQADERLQSHLVGKFQHQIGALEPLQQTVVQRRRQNAIAAEIAQLLRSPNGVRPVIVASEILRRPEL